MNKFAKAFVIVVFTGLVAGYCARVVQVNSNLDLPVVKTFEKGDVVPYDKDFMGDATISPEGYSVQVLDTHTYTKKEFTEKYDVTIGKEQPCEYVYTVDLKIYNDNKELDEMNGISVYNMYLKSTNYFSYPDGELTVQVSSLPGIGFSLRPESNMDITLVYTMNEEYFDDIDEIKNTDFRMMITDYPTAKLLELG